MFLYFAVAVTATTHICIKFANFICEATQTIYVDRSREPEMRLYLIRKKWSFPSQKSSSENKVISEFVIEEVLRENDTSVTFQAKVWEN